MAPPPIESLPLELRQMILASLDSYDSVRTAIASSPFFYRAFLRAEHSILSEILRREIDSETFPDAIIALQVSKIDLRDTEEILEMLASWYSHRAVPIPRCTLADTTCSKLHAAVVFFADAFVSSTLCKHPVTGDPETSPRPPTATEWTRIQRAFYRFELYSVLFRRPVYNGSQYDIYGAVQKREMFFRRYSACEIEQLACVYEYLFLHMSPGSSSLPPVFYRIWWLILNLQPSTTLLSMTSHGGRLSTSLEILSGCSNVRRSSTRSVNPPRDTCTKSPSISDLQAAVAWIGTSTQTRDCPNIQRTPCHPRSNPTLPLHIPLGRKRRI